MAGPGPLQFHELPKGDPLHRALAGLDELYKATNFQTWWDARAFAVAGPRADDWDPGALDQVDSLASFVEDQVLPAYPAARGSRFHEQIARVGGVGWPSVRDGLLDALKHHPTSGGKRPGESSLRLAPEAFLLLDLLEEQVAGALGFGAAEDLAAAPPERLRCVRLRPHAGSCFEGTLYQHLFLVWAPVQRRLLWFDLGGSR